jgi:hypothetical protein
METGLWGAVQHATSYAEAKAVLDVIERGMGANQKGFPRRN